MTDADKTQIRNIILLRAVRLLAITPLLCIAMTSYSLAQACSDAARGAKSISEAVSDDDLSPAAVTMFAGACVVRWVGGTRGQAGRDEDRARCGSLSNTTMLEFIPDRGSNYNVCIFRMDTEAPRREPAPQITRPPQEEPVFRPTPRPTPRPAPQLAPARPAPDDNESNRSYRIVLCNNNKKIGIDAAIRYPDWPEGYPYKVEGWWTIEPNTCKTIKKGNLPPFYGNSILVYGMNRRENLVWSGKTDKDEEMCIRYGNRFVFELFHLCGEGNEKLVRGTFMLIDEGDNKFTFR